MSEQTWLLVAPAENPESAREISGALALEMERTGKDLGLRVTRDEVRRKLYLGLPLKSAAVPVVAISGKIAEIPDRLPVPYYYQFDSATNQGHRMCNSSTNAMLVKFLKPGALSNSPNADDEYLARVRQYGDTTDHGAQLKALAFFGIHPQFRKDLTWEQIDAQLRRGLPVPIAILHNGPISAPYGGHCLLIIGKTGSGYRVNDPAGELDLVNGGYPSGGSGKGAVYSKANLDRRWRVGGESWGYLL